MACFLDLLRVSLTWPAPPFQFYHVFSSNHPELSAAAFAPIVDYMPAARAQAKRVAAQAKLPACDATALNYPCHLAPWGQQSRDTRTYM